MRLCQVVSAALLIIGAPALGQADKPNTSRTTPGEKSPAALVLASAEPARPPAPAASKPAAMARKKIEPRVTACRCGDPRVEADPDIQDQ